MKLYKYPPSTTWQAIIKRPVTDITILTATVRKILRNVKEKGDKAIIKYTREFDQVNLERLQVTDKEIRDAAALVGDELKKSILQAKKNIETFHSAQKEKVKMVETMPGVVCWRRSLPIEKVGLYIPGGSAPLFSTVLMLCVPAQLAGCKDVILCTPAGKDGRISPAILYTARLCGITKIFKIGGAQAIAAMTYGTESIPKVFKIFGPGNQYVTLAKQLVQLEGIAIDMPAGPSELLVLADDTAVPEFVAADVLSQAEHGPDSQVLLVTYSRELVKKARKEIAKQLENLPRKEITRKALANSKIILVKNMVEAIAFTNLYAPEHLVLCCAKAREVSQKITSSGSVFIGNYSPESAGDYATGTNHTLPTNGYAAMYSGVSLDSFVKKITYQQLTKKGLKSISSVVMTMAKAEGLDAHKNSVEIRFKK